MICFCCSKQLEPEAAFYGLHEDCFVKSFKLDKPALFNDLVRRQGGTDEQSKWSALNSSFYQGKFKKYSANLANKSYILKIQQKDYPDLPAMEYLCNQVAEYVDLNVPPYVYILFENKLPTFVCENFMQFQQSSNLIHIYHFMENPDEYNCEKLYQIILEKTERFRDGYRFVELTLFDGLLGNHDRHGRNIALIQSPNGYTLSPFYDNPCYLGLEDELLLTAQHEPRGKIATSATADPTLRDYIKEWQRLGCIEVVANFEKKINIEEIIKMIDKSFISPKRKEALKKLVSNRYREFKNELAG